MQLLTPSGYVDVSTLHVGDSVCAFDENTGAPITNTIERHERWEIMDGVLKSFDLATGEEIGPQFSEWKFYRINGTWTLFCEQSIWRNGTNVCHAKHLAVGDEIYDDTDAPVAITSIEEVASDLWYRFDISGDHSYIVDNLTLHNASRFCKPGVGTADWTSSNTGIWAATSAGATGSSVPGSADAVTCDGNFGGGTCRVNFGGAIAIQSITCGAMIGTLDFSVFNNDITLSATTAFSGTGTATRTLNLGNGTWTISTATVNVTVWNMSTVTNLTFNANASVIDFTGAMSAGSGQTMQTGGKTFSTVRVSGSRLNAGLTIAGGGTVGTLTNTAAATINVAAAITATTLTASAQLCLILSSGATTTITNAPTLTASLSAPVFIVTGFAGDLTGTSTISCGTGTFGGTYCGLQGVTFSGGATFAFTNSFDLGRNSGATITAPSTGSAGMLYVPNMDGV